MTRELFSLWIGGSLSLYEQMCFASFVKSGYQVHLFTYENVKSVPAGVQILDAREIVPIENRWSNPGAGGSWADFSNQFRYRAIRETGFVWIDADVLAGKQPITAIDGYVMGRESPEMVNGAVLGAPSTSNFLKQLEKKAEVPNLESYVWGSLGPRLITSVVEELDLLDKVQPSTAFYPVQACDSWKFFDPQSADELWEIEHSSSGIHLWNEEFRRARLPVKSFAPPTGSFLGQLLSRLEIAAEEIPRVGDSWGRKTWRHQLNRNSSVVSKIINKTKIVVGL